MKKIVIIFIICYFVFLPKALANTEYAFPWPGILPDNKIYKLKVLRNKLIEKMIISPVKKVEFDLLMADKTLYASKLLLDKGEISLAKETALKGENYFSVLVSDYATAVARKEKIPEELNKKITRSYEAHQKLIKYLIAKANEKDRETYTNVDYFSKTNYDKLLKIQKEKNKKVNK